MVSEESGSIAFGIILFAMKRIYGSIWIISITIQLNMN